MILVVSLMSRDIISSLKDKALLRLFVVMEVIRKKLVQLQIRLVTVC